MFPTLAKDFLNGLKLAISDNSPEIDPEFVIEGIGNASDDSIVQKAEKLLLQEDVDITISFCSIFFLNQLRNVFDSYKKPLIFVDLGGNLIKKEHLSDYVLHSSLNLCQSAYAAGVYAANTFGKKGAIASSFYDGGYQMSESFVKGFKNMGGEIVYYHVAPMDYKSESYEKMIEGLQTSQADFVFTLFSFKEGEKVFTVLAESGLNGSLPILCLALLTDETAHQKDYRLKKVLSLASWSFDDERPEMKEFLSAYSSEYKQDPNLFSLLGYESGLATSRAMKFGDSEIGPIGKILKGRTINSPRGEITYNNYHESQADSFKIREFNYNEIRYHNHVIGTVDTPVKEEIYDLFENIPYTGWRNPYICT